MRFLFALLLALPLFAHAAQDDLLEPEKAFGFSARALDADTLEIRYRIADGYYLYRDKLAFALEPADLRPGTPRLPAGKIKEDEFFGRMETYRGELVIRLPVERGDAGERALTLKATSQGCADIGVCFPPTTQSASLNLPARAAPAGALDRLRDLIGLGGGAPADLLAPEQAYPMRVEARDAATLAASIDIAPDYYLYRDKLRFELKDAPAGVAIERVDLPRGEARDDPFFGRTEIYRQPVQAVIRLAGASAGATLDLRITYQGCAEKAGVCFPPETRAFSLTLPATAAAAPPAETAQAAVNEEDRIARLIQGSGFWAIVLSFFGFGLLLALTPCVFPMIPILSGIIVGQGQHVTKTHGFMLSLAYVLGMAITYAIAGVIAGLSGALLSAALQNPWVLGSFALVFVLLALSMFGFYELQLPSALQSRLTAASNRMKGGTYAGVFVMGVLSAIIVGPCVAAPLAGALLYIGQTHDVVLGGSALFAMALGMGAPLLLIGVSAGALLPRAGAWMKAVKSFFGVLLLGVAIWLISPVIPALVHMLLWAGLLIVSAIYLHALDPLPAGAGGFARFWKGLGVIALVTGLALLIGVLSGSRDVLQPLAGLRAAPAGATGAAPTLKFDRVRDTAELDARLAQAAGRPVMLKFHADWCVSCKEFELLTLSDPTVQARLAGVVLLTADVTENNAADKALLKRFNLFGPPGIILFGAGGRETGRVIGFQRPDEFLASLDAAFAGK